MSLIFRDAVGQYSTPMVGQFSMPIYTKGGFPNENSLLKLLYLGIQNASKKWTMPIQNWALTLSQLAIFFEGRLDDALEL